MIHENIESEYHVTLGILTRHDREFLSKGSKSPSSVSNERGASDEKKGSKATKSPSASAVAAWQSIDWELKFSS